MKFLIFLVLGFGAGYYFGFSDGSEGRPSIATRFVQSIGGDSRGKVRNDIDATMDRLDGTAPSDSARAAARRSGRARNP